MAVSGRFAAVGSALESELWCPLDDLQTAMKRQDLSLVAAHPGAGPTFEDVDEFCKERLDLEIQATPETAYYAALQKHYRPVRDLAWLVVGLVAGAGVFAGLNAMYGSVVGRVQELATLQTIGFIRRAITLSLIQEAVLLAAAASLLAAVVALRVLNGAAVRFTMGAFALRDRRRRPAARLRHRPAAGRGRGDAAGLPGHAAAHRRWAEGGLMCVSPAQEADRALPRDANHDLSRLIVLGRPAVAGCADGTARPGWCEETARPAVPARPATGPKFLLAAEPAGAKGVIDVRKEAKDGDEVVVVGQVGGDKQPFTEGRASFLIVDPSLQACTRTDR